MWGQENKLKLTGITSDKINKSTEHILELTHIIDWVNNIFLQIMQVQGYVHDTVFCWKRKYIVLHASQWLKKTN